MVDFHDQWQSRTVRVRNGPFANWVGMVGGTFNPRVQVSFPMPNGCIERLWMFVEDLEILEGVKV